MGRVEPGRGPHVAARTGIEVAGQAPCCRADRRGRPAERAAAGNAAVQAQRREKAGTARARLALRPSTAAMEAHDGQSTLAACRCRTPACPVAPARAGPSGAINGRFAGARQAKPVPPTSAEVMTSPTRKVPCGDGGRHGAARAVVGLATGSQEAACRRGGRREAGGGHGLPFGRPRRRSARRRIAAGDEAASPSTAVFADALQACRAPLNGRPGALISARRIAPFVESVTNSVLRSGPPNARLVVETPAGPRSTHTGRASVSSIHT